MNPGERLRSFFNELYPNEKGFKPLEKISVDLKNDDEIIELFHKSLLDYLVRRFLKTAESYRRKYPPDNYGEGKYRSEFEDYLYNYTNYTRTQISQISSLIAQCIYASNTLISDGTRNNLVKKSKAEDRNCYICGTNIDYSKKNNTVNSYSLDHKWPHSLGGLSSEENLDIACADCNSKMGDYIDYADFHFEYISFKYLSNKDYDKNSSKLYEFPILDKFDYSCSVCGKTTQQVGKLYIDKKDPSDGWHFLNLTTYCSIHIPEL